MCRFNVNVSITREAHKILNDVVSVEYTRRSKHDQPDIGVPRCDECCGECHGALGAVVSATVR